MSDNSIQVCRPQHLTCRWVNEMTAALQKICPSLPRPSECVPSQAEQVWQEYWSQFNRHQCAHHPVVQQVLAFEIDYREISKK